RAHDPAGNYPGGQSGAQRRRGSALSRTPGHRGRAGAFARQSLGSDRRRGAPGLAGIDSGVPHPQAGDRQTAVPSRPGPSRPPAKSFVCLGMKNSLTTLLVIFLSCVASRAQSVEGSVFDASTGAGVSGVLVELLKQTTAFYETTTDGGGRFRFDDIKEGDYSV